MSQSNTNQPRRDGIPSSQDLDETSVSGSPKPGDDGVMPNVNETGHFEIFDDSPDETTALGSNTRLEPDKSKDSKKVPTRMGGYSLGPLLGQGGMGRVFQAEDSSGASVALKLLSPSLSSSPEALARFKQEGLIASQINHPNIVFVHRVDEEKGTPFIAMELMTGKTLKDLVVDGGPLPYSEAVKLILQCIEGLIEAHCRGMIHRDIKPANCYLDEDGQVKIGDFGLARSLVSDSELTQTGAFLGTPLFASPEQLLGQKIDNRSDIYSLSATLYYLLAGKAPFESPNAAQVIARIASSDPPSFESVEIEVPQPLEEIVMKGLSRDSSKRFNSFLEMRDELLKVMAPRPEPASFIRRVLAGIADNFVVTILFGIFAALLAVTILPKMESNLFSEILALLVTFVFYFFSEWLFGTTIGKAALHIHVVDSQTFRKPTAGKAAKRVLAFLSIGSGLSFLFSSLLYGYGVRNPMYFALMQSFAGLLGYAINIAFWFYFGKNKTLFDWLSGTECQITQHTHVPSAHLSLPQWSPSSLSGKTLIPQSLGRFLVHREITPIAIANDKNVRWFEGVDQQLDRTVWLAFSEDADLQIEDRRAKPKWNRIRFIEEGKETNGRWFAYLAPDGVPLDHCLINGVQLSWPQTRSLINQIAGLAEAQGWQGALPASCKLWIDRAGRLSLVDFDPAPITAKPESAPKDFTAPENSVGLNENHFGSEIECQDLIASICRLALSPSHPYRRKFCKKQEITSGKRDSSKLDVQVLLPASARKLCESFASGKARPNLQRVISDFQQLGNGPSTISIKTRVLNSVLSLTFLVPLMVLIWGMSLAPAIIYYGNLIKGAQSIKTMQAIANDPFLDAANWNGASEKQKEYCTSAEGKSRIDTLSAQLQQRLERSFESLGTVEKAIWTQIPISGSVTNPNRLQMIGEDKNSYQEAFPVSNNIEDFSFSFGFKKTAPSLFGTWKERDMERAMRLIESKDERLNLFDGSSEISWSIVWVPLCFCFVWTFLTFGGVSQYLTGISFVKRDGRKIGFLRSFIRALLLYLPFFVIVYVMSAWPLVDESDVFWNTQLKRIIAVIPLVYLASILFRSNRTLLDTLTGTAATPR